MNIRKIDDEFSVTGQITPEQVKAVSAAGFKGIVCARPDERGTSGQPSFAEIARPRRAPPKLTASDRPHPVFGHAGRGPRSSAFPSSAAWENLPKPDPRLLPLRAPAPAASTLREGEAAASPRWAGQSAGRGSGKPAE